MSGHPNYSPLYYFHLVEKLRANCQVFLSFGSEAFLSSLEWSLITIAYFPNFQKAISHEIEQVIGDQRFPDFSDQFRMPFTVAFLNEVLRWKTVLPFNFIRRYAHLFMVLNLTIDSQIIVELLKMQPFWEILFPKERSSCATFGLSITIP